MEYFKNVVEMNPKLFKRKVNNIVNFCSKKLWYEFGETLVEVLNYDAIVGERKSIYENYVVHYLGSMDQEHVYEIILLVSKDLVSPGLCIEFINEQMKKIRNRSGELKLKFRIASLKTQNGLFEEAVKMLNSFEKEVKEGSSSEVVSLYYKTKMEVEQSRGDYDELYKDILYFLSSSRLVNDIFICFNLCVSALLSKRVISLHDVAVHPILNNLLGTDKEWMYELIQLFEHANTNSIDIFDREMKTKLQGYYLFNDNIDHIRQKLLLNVLLSYIISKSFMKRSFTFSELSVVLKLDVEDVELLLLEALDQNVIKGFIDGVDSTIYITWIMLLGVSFRNICKMKEHITEWRDNIKEIRSVFEDKSKLFS